MLMTIRLMLHTLILGISVCLSAPLFGAAEMPADRALQDLLDRHFDADIIDEITWLNASERDRIAETATKVSTTLKNMPPHFHAIPGYQENCHKILQRFTSIHDFLHNYASINSQQAEARASIAEITASLPPEIAEQLKKPAISKEYAVKTLKAHGLHKSIQPFVSALGTLLNIENTKNTIENNAPGILDTLHELREMQIAYIENPDADIDCGITVSISLDSAHDAEIIKYAQTEGLINCITSKKSERKESVGFNQEFDVFGIRKDKTAFIFECKNTPLLSKYIGCPQQQLTILNCIKHLMEKYPDNWQDKIKCNRPFETLKALVDAPISLHAGHTPDEIERLARTAARANVSISHPEGKIVGHDFTRPATEDGPALGRTRIHSTPKKAKILANALKRKRLDDQDNDDHDDEVSAVFQSPPKRQRINVAARFDAQSVLSGRLSRFAEELDMQGITPGAIAIDSEDPEIITAIARIFTPKTGSTPVPFGTLFLEETFPGKLPTAPTRYTPISRTTDSARAATAEIHGRLSALSLKDNGAGSAADMNLGE